MLLATAESKILDFHDSKRMKAFAVKYQQYRLVGVFCKIFLQSILRNGFTAAADVPFGRGVFLAASSFSGLRFQQNR